MDSFNAIYSGPDVFNTASLYTNTHNGIYFIMANDTKPSQVQQTQASVEPGIPHTLEPVNISSHLTDSNHFTLDMKRNKNTPVKNNTKYLDGRMYCSLCTNKFTKKQEFDEHYVKYHPNESIVYVCSICRKQESDFNKFRNHYYRHYRHGERRCDLCPEYRFTQITHWKDHCKVFHPEKYEELVLEHSPIAKPSLKVTAEEKTFSLVCSVCAQQFTEKNLYDEHCKKKHQHNYIFYDCSICHRSFKKFDNFKNHICELKHVESSYLRHNNSKKADSLETIFSNNNYFVSDSILNKNMDGYGTVKDLTLAFGLKGKNEWNSTLNHNIDENQNVCKILDEDNTFHIDTSDACDIFEKLHTILPEMDLLGGNQKLNFGENNSTRSKMSPQSIDMCSPSSNITSVFSSDYENSVTPLDINPTSESLHVENKLNRVMKHGEDDVMDCPYLDEIDSHSAKNNNLSVPNICSNDSALYNTAVDFWSYLPNNNQQIAKSDNSVSNIVLNDINKEKSNEQNDVCQNRDTTLKESYLVCYVCKANVTSRGELHHHIGKEHPMWHVIYKCRHCNIHEYHFDKYIKHICWFILSRRKRCLHCKQVFGKQCELAKHMDVHHKDRPVISRWAHYGILCKICNKKLPEKRLYDAHFREAHSERIWYTCVWCNKRSSNYESFRSHCNTHITRDKFKCMFCGKGFPKKIKLSIHEKFHFGENNSTKSKMSPQSIDTCSSSSNITSVFSSDYENSIIPLDINLACESLNVENKLNQVVKHTEDDIMDCQFLDEFDSHSAMNDCNTFFVNSPESGIDCMNSPSSDILSLVSSPESSDFSVSSFNNNCQEDKIKILCILCDTKISGRKAFDKHTKMYHNKNDIIYGCIFCNKTFTLFDNFYCHWHQCQSSQSLQLDVNEDGNNYQDIESELFQNINNESNETEYSHCFNSEFLSKYKIDNCIKSVINTMEDSKHSVICNEYNKGIKYDIVKYNDKSLDILPEYNGSQDKQTQQADKYQINTVNDNMNQHQYINNTSTQSESNVTRSQGTVVNQGMLATAYQHFNNITLNNNKTGKINIINDQSTESFSSSRKQSNIINHLHSNTGNLDIQNNSENMDSENNTQMDVWSTQSGWEYTLTNMGKHIVKYSPLVVMINVIVSTSPTSPVVEASDTNSGNVTNTILSSNNTNSNNPHHTHNTLRGFRRKPKTLKNHFNQIDENNSSSTLE